MNNLPQPPSIFFDTEYINLLIKEEKINNYNIFCKNYNYYMNLDELIRHYTDIGSKKKIGGISNYDNNKEEAKRLLKELKYPWSHKPNNNLLLRRNNDLHGNFDYNRNLDIRYYNKSIVEGVSNLYNNGCYSKNEFTTYNDINNWFYYEGDLP